MAKKRGTKARIITSTALRITPLLIAVAMSGGWVLSLFQDDIKGYLLERDLGNYVNEDVDDTPRESDVIVIPTIEPEEDTTLEEEEEVIEEEKPFERISSELYDMEYSIPEIDFDALNEINPDVQGWIRIDGTKIDYPLLQGEDNQYYLKHDINKKSNSLGSIFLDVRSSSLDREMPELSDVSYVYGHHMASGTMFATLVGYKNQAFLEANPFGVLRVENGDLYKLDFFAGIVVSGEDDSVIYTPDFADEDEFNAYYDRIKEQSMISADVDLQLGDKVIALVTCSYETNNSRFVLFARMTKQLEKEIIDQMNNNNETNSLSLSY